LKLLKSDNERSSPAFATVVTDLTRCHSTWFHKGVDRCFVANGVVANQARERNLSDDQIICHGLPIRPAFSTVNAQANKLALRSKLGLDTHASTVMLIGGGEGMGKIAAITEALSRRLSVNDQLIVICGRNESLASKLTRRKWDTKVVVKGFINNMAEYMASCDCVITKAGPGTIAEALTCGLPIILNGKGYRYVIYKHLMFSKVVYHVKKKAIFRMCLRMVSVFTVKTQTKLRKQWRSGLGH
jgi:1,2-diacylglycerol 3-beta-galactosyltransferase